MSVEFASVKFKLLHGCPFSALLLIFFAWERGAVEVGGDQMTATVYVDDRTVWHAADSDSDQKFWSMKEVLDMGKEFNEQFWVDWSQEFEGKVGAHIKILGIGCHSDGRSAQVRSNKTRHATHVKEDRQSNNRTLVITEIRE